MARHKKERIDKFSKRSLSNDDYLRTFIIIDKETSPEVGERVIYGEEDVIITKIENGMITIYYENIGEEDIISHNTIFQQSIWITNKYSEESRILSRINDEKCKLERRIEGQTKTIGKNLEQLKALNNQMSIRKED